MLDLMYDFVFYVILFTWGVLKMLLIAAVIVGVPLILWKLIK